MKEQLKSHKSVEQIAKKHRLSVSFIQKQLDMGEPIEHEHTKDHTLAMDIALQHLDEIPDYYTRLKKMEASAKKEHKKFKDVKESHDEQRYCPLCDKRETRSECSYGNKAWEDFSVKDHEYSMIRSELSTVMNAAQRLQKKMGKGEGNVEAWVQSKITKAADYLDTAADYVASGEMSESKALGFEIKPSRGAGALTPSAAAQLGDKAVALQKKKAAAVSLPKVKEEKIVDKILGELQEEDPCWKGYTQVGMKKKAGKPVPNCVPSKGVPKAKGYKEEVVHEGGDFWHPDPEQDRKLGGPGANQRAREDRAQSTSPKTTPDYSNKLKPGESYMQFAKRKTAEKMKEDVTIEDANGKLYAEVIDLIKPEPMVSPKSTFMANNELEEATRLQAETGNIIAVILSWRGKTYSIRMFFPQAGMPSRKDITLEIQKVYPGAQVIQFNVSTIQAGMPLIQVVNSKSKNYLLNNKTIGEETIEEVAAWQRKEGKSQSGGLNEKGRKSYEREHPGSNLKAPQPEGGSRRDSFCARMKGMKKKLTSAKTANDPDSRINKSLRAWNC